MVRAVASLTFFIAGLLISNAAFFEQHPLFGKKYLAEVSISFVAALLGFYTIPKFFVQVKHWFEEVIARTTSNIVTSFWDQQNRRLQEARREKQRKEKERNKKRKVEAQLRQRLCNATLLDTSTLVDGRVLDVAKVGFLAGDFVVPQIVINELHLIADNKDPLKRGRGRRGLDVLNKLKKHAKVEIFNEPKISADVDKSLISLAKKYKLKLMTLDFNLNKVASVANVTVLNINELSNALRPVLLPGETLKLKVVEKGKEEDQGVGYLDDGTMIIIAGAAMSVGKQVPIRVKKIIQSPAGKMIFAEKF